MRYIDNGNWNPRDHALVVWLRTVLTADVVEIAWQSGFFEAGVLGVFEPTLLRLASAELSATVLIGSNDGETQASSVRDLVEVLGLPRPKARLGIVSYADGFYHPKTIYVRLGTGRQVAYVGSANLTSRGINGLNVEAGITLDTDQGDPPEFLRDVQRAASAWFDSSPDGFFSVETENDVDSLLARGILATEPAVRQVRSEDSQYSRNLPARRASSHELPKRLPRRGPTDPARPNGSNVAIPIAGQVLIAELAGPGRWGQAAFPKWFVDNFFQVQPGTSDRLRLELITPDGDPGTPESVACGHKAGSKNWYFELGLAAKIGKYPPPPRKPIGVFHRTDGRHTFRYTILMPDDDSYVPVLDCLRANRARLKRPKNELLRTIVPAADLRAAWSDDWFFRS